MTTFEKLAIKIEKDTGLVLTNFVRTYAGNNQRSQGAFVWTAWGKSELYGSGEPATELLKKDKLEVIGYSSEIA